MLFYLQQKSKPKLQSLTSLDQLKPIIQQFESGEMQSIGYFSIVLGAFTRSPLNADAHVDADTATDTLNVSHPRPLFPLGQF